MMQEGGKVSLDAFIQCFSQGLVKDEHTHALRSEWLEEHPAATSLCAGHPL